MSIKTLLGSDLSDHEIMAKIKKAVEMGLSEIKVDGAIIKLPQIDTMFEKHIAPWEN